MHILETPCDLTVLKIMLLIKPEAQRDIRTNNCVINKGVYKTHNPRDIEKVNRCNLLELKSGQVH